MASTQRNSLRLPFPVLAASILAGTAAWAAANPYGPGSVLFALRDTKISESSGLATSGKSDQLLWTHNDSGDNPRLYAIGPQGQTLSTFKVTGADAVDWEDMARAPGPDGAPWLYVGDIGDNDAERSTIAVYGVPEPEVDVTRTGARGETAPAAKYVLRYADGPRDAETLLIHPVTRRLFIVSKRLTGSQVYAAPLPLRTDAPNTLTWVGKIDFSKFPNSAKGLKQQVYAVLATSGDISPDGKRVVVRTYTDAYEWTIPRNDVAAAFRAEPAYIPLPATKQGEAIAYSRDGQSLLTTTEGENAPFHQLRKR